MQSTMYREAIVLHTSTAVKNYVMVVLLHICTY